jgi:hypothetical protein
VDVVNDGEYVKAGSYTGYINQRITGIEIQLADPNRPSKHAGTGGRDRAVSAPGLTTTTTRARRRSSLGPLRPCARNIRQSPTPVSSFRSTSQNSRPPGSSPQT